ncbi:hemoglobin subunit alpha-2-like [Hyla sarda]|uniref:hemoglobin subunit alpha-2-like n=1 Tax=Hyla sarda TaxID=327740 RepID=UPI0024C2481F|nr:hemoglobin subunit alpha-2-like [Hyla sarda]
MALDADNKGLIQAIWTPIAAHADQYGAEALYRMFLSSPQTKTYFPNFDLHKDSPDIRAHGKKVFDALTKAAQHLDNIEGALSNLSDLHAFDLRVDPGNFTILAHHILVTIAIHHPDKFDSLTHQALDKFLAAVGCALTSKYR